MSLRTLQTLLRVSTLRVYHAVLKQQNLGRNGQPYRRSIQIFDLQSMSATRKPVRKILLSVLDCPLLQLHNCQPFLLIYDLLAPPLRAQPSLLQCRNLRLSRLRTA